MKNNCLSFFLKVHICITFILISLGGAVRAMNAGLACPDWPLCFGKVVPDFQVQVYYEFIHRVIAGSVALMMLGLLFYILRNSFSKKIKITVVVASVILMTQVVLGGLTVLKLLHFSVVTAHLAFGIAFICSLLWLHFLLFEKVKVKAAPPKSFYAVLFLVSAILYIQILMGGLVSTNYAGLSCEGFPLCNGEFFPTFQGLVGLQVKHRLWGYLTVLAIFAFTNVIRKNKNAPWMDLRIYKYGTSLALLVCFQILVGAANVIYKTPPVITVVHLAIATILMGLMLKILYLGIGEKESK